jgi:hypothetical protein
MKTNYFVRFWRTLARSAKQIDRRIFLSAFHDLLFYVCTFFSVLVWGHLLKMRSAYLQFNPNNLDVTNKALVSLTVDSVRSLLIFFLVSLALFFVVFVFIYSFFKGLAWLAVKNKPLSWEFLRRFSILNTLWFLCWLAILIAVAFIFRPTAGLFFLVIILVLALHLSVVLAVEFVQTAEIMISVKKAFVLGFAKIHHFILPYLIVIVGYVAVIQIAWVAKLLHLTVNLEDYVGGAIVIIVSLLYFACVRVYVINLVKDL